MHATRQSCPDVDADEHCGENVTQVAVHCMRNNVNVRLHVWMKRLQSRCANTLHLIALVSTRQELKFPLLEVFTSFRSSTPSANISTCALLSH